MVLEVLAEAEEPGMMDDIFSQFVIFSAVPFGGGGFERRRRRSTQN
jgi:hypothetical protein